MGLGGVRGRLARPGRDVGADGAAAPTQTASPARLPPPRVPDPTSAVGRHTKTAQTRTQSAIEGASGRGGRVSTPRLDWRGVAQAGWSAVILGGGSTSRAARILRCSSLGAVVWRT